MLRNAILALACAIGTVAGASYAVAADAPAAVAPYSTGSTTIGALLDNPATKAILVKHIPQVVSNPQIDMGRAMTLKEVQSYAGDLLSDDVLIKIDADLQKLPK